MAFSIEENRKAEIEAARKTPAQKVEAVKEVVIEKTKVTVHFIFLWTAIGWYYFFSGLYMLIWKKLPNGWKRLRTEEVAHVIGNLEEFSPVKKEITRYGRVVDLDDPTPPINLLHP